MTKRTIKAVSVLILLFLLLVLSPTPVQSEPGTWYVNPPDGGDGQGDDSTGNGTQSSPWLTIQHAIDDSGVSNGDTIVVMSGTSTENVDVDKELVIQSQNGAASTFVEAASPSDHVFDVTSDNVTIGGFSISGAMDSYRAGIHLNSTTGCTISNNRCGWDDSHNNTAGIYVLDSSNNIVLDNTCNNNEFGIFLLSSSSNNTISGNTCNANGYGIILQKSSSNNTISGNTCEDNWGRGMTLDSLSNHNVVEGNNILDNT
jgi:nitrous oxidase accessory protein